MLQRDVRLGDDIDDFCVRCKRVMNHAVVSVIGGVAAKVRCRTCHSDHDFRREQPPPPKVDSRKAALFNQVLKTVDPAAATAALEAGVPEAEIEPIEAEELEAVEVDTPEIAGHAMAAADTAANHATPLKPRAAQSPAAKPAAKAGAKSKPKAKK
jgi:hypothetical protein